MIFLKKFVRQGRGETSGGTSDNRPYVSYKLKGLKALREEGLVKDFAVVSLDPVLREVDGIKIYPWAGFIKALWDGKLLK